MINNLKLNSRPQIVGPNEVEEPFPLKIQGKVQHGFNRGSKELGIPTANLPEESFHDAFEKLDAKKNTGVYFGWSKVEFDNNVNEVYPMAMSVGWNPFYKNEKLTAEVHIMNNYDKDFYNLNLKIIILGYVRPELDYVSKESLIEDIEIDKKVSLNSLQRASYLNFKSDEFFN